jgi:hypothetical protein
MHEQELELKFDSKTSKKSNWSRSERRSMSRNLGGSRRRSRRQDYGPRDNIREHIVMALDSGPS